MTAWITPVLLLLASNVFMAFAWYGHLKYKNTALGAVILISWGIAFFEYCLQVPANRWGHSVYSAAQLKTIQEILTRQNAPLQNGILPTRMSLNMTQSPAKL